MSLRIAIDASRATVSRPTGTEYYARRLIEALIELNRQRDDPHQLTLYFRDTPAPGLFPHDSHVRQVVIPWYRAWTHLRFATELWKSRPDITFVPAHSLPFLFPGKAIVTVHDLGYKRFPSAHPLSQQTYLDATTRYSQARATVILADSQATADDLRHYYATPAERIRVLYPGVDALPLQTSVAEAVAVRARYDLPGRYFLFIGTLQPRKNIHGIVRAFAMWQQQSGDRETALLLAGGKGWLFDESWIQGTENVIVTGYIDEPDKGALYSESVALIYASLYEGFGFPVIEAMICGTAVIASNTSSLPELVGDAGLLVDPNDVADIARAMRQLSEDSDLRNRMINRGRQRAKDFSWERTAQQLITVLDEIDGLM